MLLYWIEREDPIMFFDVDLIEELWCVYNTNNMDV